MTNEHKAEEIAEYLNQPNGSNSLLECHQAAMAMAQWKDKQHEQEKQQWIERVLTILTNWAKKHTKECDGDKFMRMGLTNDLVIYFKKSNEKRTTTMKANEAPEKIYFDGKSCACKLSIFSSQNIEYTRTDAFIEKAWDWLTNQKGEHTKEDFIKAMKGE